MNENRLRIAMLKNNDTMQALAKALGISVSSLYRKVNNEAGEFTQSEIRTIMRRYKLSARETVAVFLSGPAPKPKKKKKTTTKATQK